MGNIKLFLGANSGEGFINKFESIKNTDVSLYTYIIKGGPGTGKSTFMKAAAKTDENAVLFYCSSDPKSLDGVLIPSKHIMILDGTSPHVVEAKYPGAKDEILNFGRFWDSKALKKSAEQIIKLTDKNKKLHKKASEFIKNAAKAENDNYGISLASVDIEKTVTFAAEMCNKYITPKNTQAGREFEFFISAITPEGKVNFNNSLDVLADEKIVITDNFGAVSDMILSIVRERAVKNGYDIISILDNLAGESRINHIVIPELSVAFCTQKEGEKISSSHRKIHATRFSDKAYIFSKRSMIAFNKKAAEELIENAVIYLNEAKKVHDELEELYMAAMDYTALDKFTTEFIDNI